MTVRLYLDVDGVVNAWFAGYAWNKDTQKVGHATSRSGTYKIIWAPEMIEALNAMDIEVVWTTTWREHAAPEIGALVGLAEDARHLVPVDPDMYPFPSIDWKVIAVEQEQATDPSPFIWIDDEIDGRHVLRARALGGLPMSPDPNLGITPAMVERMIEYVKKAKWVEENEQAADVS